MARRAGCPLRPPANCRPRPSERPFDGAIWHPGELTALAPTCLDGSLACEVTAEGPAMFRCVMSLHGIRTRGVWQKDLVPVLARAGFIPYALDYGTFSTFSFASGRARENKLKWLIEEYGHVTADAESRRPSIIAHSFGTYLVKGAIDHGLRFDKVIFAGSIVASDFGWPRVLESGQVNLVRNDFGALDPWPRMSRWLVHDSGNSGTSGFTTNHPRLFGKSFPAYRHSDYFHRTHFEREWIPTLMRVVVAQDERWELTNLLDVTCQVVATRLNIGQQLVRSNIFVPDEARRLRIPDGLTHNMWNAAEQTVTIMPGTGCCGVAFERREQTVAVMRADWGKHTLPGTELAKVDPRLKWIVSTPIPDPDIAGAVLGVFNVDGLVQSKTQDDLEPILDDLLVAAQLLAVSFNRLK